MEASHDFNRKRNRSLLRDCQITARWHLSRAPGLGLTPVGRMPRRAALRERVCGYIYVYCSHNTNMLIASLQVSGYWAGTPPTPHPIPCSLPSLVNPEDRPRMGEDLNPFDASVKPRPRYAVTTPNLETTRFQRISIHYGTGVTHADQVHTPRTPRPHTTRPSGATTSFPPTLAHERATLSAQPRRRDRRDRQTSSPPCPAPVPGLERL